tara:strand:+ start:888 stop:1598 length:711 start_codon:yes stop_codon:yes gene_type:complete
MNKDFQIVVPFYNDYKNFLKFIEIINQLETDKEIFILLDNGSSNGEMLNYQNKNLSDNQCWKVVRSENNLGFGGGIKFCSQYVDSEFIGWMPGNMKLDPLDVFSLFNETKSQDKDFLLKAYRSGRPFLDYIKTLIFGLIATLYTRYNMFDAGGTPSLTSKKLFNKLDNLPDDFTFDIFVLYFFRFNNLKVIRPKIKYTTRMHGKSHWQDGLLTELNFAFSIFSSLNRWKKENRSYE